MAENYKDTLSAKAKALAPQRATEESVEVEIAPGVVKKIVRKGLSDDQWARVKQRAVKVLKSSVSYESDKAPTEAELEAGRSPDVKARMARADEADREEERKRKHAAFRHMINDDNYAVGEGSLISSEREREVLRRMDPDAAMSFMEQRLQVQSRKDEEAARQRQSDKGKLTDENSPTPTMKIPGTSPDQGTPDEWKTLPKSKPQVPTTTQTEDDIYLGSAGVSGSTPMARMASMAQQAATGATPAAPAAAEGTEVTQQTTPATGIQGPASLLDPGTPADLERMGMGRNAPSLLQPQDAPNEQQMAAREDLGLDPLTAEPPLNPPTQAQPPVAPVPPTGNGGASLDMRLAPQVAGPNVQMATGDMRQWRAAADATKQKLADLEETRAAGEIIQDGITRESNKRRVETMQQMERDAALAKQARLNAIEEANRYQSAKVSVLEEARRAAAEPTDPNRFWNNKTDGQKAAGIIAGALFGFTGQGMQWLNRVDALVENDMRVQMADRSSKVQGLQAQAQGLGEAGQLAMQRGASEAEAYLIDKQAKLEGLNVFLQGMAEKSKNVEQKMRAAEMSVQLSGHIANLEMQGAQLSEMAASRRNQFMLEKEKMRIDAEQGNAALRIKAAGEGGANRPLPEAGAKLMDEYSSAVQALKEMQGKLANKGPGDRLLQKFAQSNFVPGNADEKALYNDYRALKYKWMTLKARGALQGIEIAALEDMLPERGQVMSDPAAQVKAMESTAERDFARAIAQQEAAGFDMSRYKAMVAPSKPQYGNVQFQPK